MKKRLLVVAAALVLLSPTIAVAGEAVVIDDFEEGLSKKWKSKKFDGVTKYEVIESPQGKVLKAVAKGAASGLFYEIDFDPNECRTLSWRWKVERTLSRGDAKVKSGDDYAARLYIVYPSWFFPLTRSVNYIFANKVPKGKVLPNTFTSQAMMIAVRSGEGEAGVWHLEKRDLVEDFRNAFGEEPIDAGGIAIMTDTDQTGDTATAYYDDIILECAGE